jgi:hypothetical protein
MQAFSEFYSVLRTARGGYFAIVRPLVFGGYYIHKDPFYMSWNFKLLKVHSHLILSEC